MSEYKNPIITIHKFGDEVAVTASENGALSSYAEEGVLMETVSYESFVTFAE